MSELEKNSKEYEISYLLSPEIAEEKLDLEIAELKKIISENGEETVDSNMPKKRWLSYPVKKQKQAYFGVIYFEAPTDSLVKIKNSLSSNKKIIRFLIINNYFKPKITVPPVKSKEPQPQIQSFERRLESILKG